MITLAGLLELDFEQPSLDYNTIMKVTKIITNDNEKSQKEMFVRMCFNVFAHNRDDHAKNFTFIYDDNKRKWDISPAYDLTYSTTYYGEHTTTVDGNGSEPSKDNLLNVGLQAGLDRKYCLDSIDKVRTYVNDMLKEYLK